MQWCDTCLICGKSIRIALKQELEGILMIRTNSHVKHNFTWFGLPTELIHVFVEKELDDGRRVVGSMYGPPSIFVRLIA